MSNVGGMSTPSSSPLVAVVGAGFAGLSLAIALKRRGLESVTIFESRSGDAVGTSYVVGDLFLPHGRESMRQLGMSKVWEQLTKETGRPNFIPQEGLQREMRRVVSSEKIRYGHRVIGINEDNKSGGLFVNCIIKAGNGRRKDKGKERREGPFDFVVGADGVLSCVRKCSVAGGTNFNFSARDNVALLGDGRWCQDRFDLGSRRIKCGADIALQDGIELAKLLSSRDAWNLGKFSAKKKRHEIAARRMNIGVTILTVLLWQQFPFENRKTNIAPLLFVAATVHIGGIMRLHLPASISDVPITLHTLAACFCGMAFGWLGCQGTMLYIFIWAVHHIYTGTNINSLGYVLGLMPCAILSAALCDEGYHPILAAAIGQSATLLLGVLWLFVVSSDPSVKMSQVLRYGALPFLPGLLIKSIVAWWLLGVVKAE